MKKFRYKINLAAITFMIGFGATVAAKSLSTDTAWFYLNSAGTTAINNEILKCWITPDQ